MRPRERNSTGYQGNRPGLSCAFFPSFLRLRWTRLTFGLTGFSSPHELVSGSETRGLTLILPDQRCST